MLRSILSTVFQALFLSLHGDASPFNFFAAVAVGWFNITCLATVSFPQTGISWIILKSPKNTGEEEKMREIWTIGNALSQVFSCS